MSQNKLETTEAGIQTIDANQIDAVSGGLVPLVILLVATVTIISCNRRQQ